MPEEIYFIDEQTTAYANKEIAFSTTVTDIGTYWDVIYEPEI